MIALRFLSLWGLDLPIPKSPLPRLLAVKRRYHHQVAEAGKQMGERDRGGTPTGFAQAVPTVSSSTVTSLLFLVIRLDTMNFVALDFETANEKRDSACAIGVTVVRDGTVSSR